MEFDRGVFRMCTKANGILMRFCGQAGNEIVTGYTDSGLFGSAGDLNREQMAVMMYRYAKYKGYDVTKTADLSQFEDATNVSGFAGGNALGCRNRNYYRKRRRNKN